VWPIPGATQTVTMKYIHWPAELVAVDVEAAIILPSRYHRRVLVNGTVYKLYLMEDDPELAREFKNLYEEAIERMRSDLWKRQYDQPDYVHVLDYDY